MNKKILIIAILAVIGIGGGTFTYTNNQASNKEAERMAMQKKGAEALAMKKEQETAAMAKEKTGEVMEKETDTVAMAKGNYTDYNASKLASAENGKVILYFYAPWCPICRESNKNFEASPAPDGLTLLKVDYDSSGDLKKKYGVTYQHTFVQVDKDGKLLKKWNGSKNYDEIKAQEL